MKKKRVLLSPYALNVYGWLSSCFFFFGVNAQEFDMKTYTTKDGLSSSFVWGISQDKLGYLWIGTPDGVNRFDGKDFINYGIAEGLPDSRTSAIFMDNRYRQWINTRRGMAELKGDKFVVYPLSDAARLRVSDVVETEKGQIWALTNAGIYEFRNDKWWKIKMYPGYENSPCRGIAETADGIYINYGNLLVLLTPTHSFKIIGPYNKVSYYYNSLKLFGKEVFISTPDGLCSIKNNRLEKLKGVLGMLKGIYTYFRDSKKRFWVGDESMGLRMIEAGDTLHLKQIYKRPSVNLISGITEDIHGNIWVADYNGLVKLTEAKYKIFTAPKISDSPAIRNMLQPPLGPLFVNNGSLTLQEYKDGKFIPRKLGMGTNSVLPNNEMIIDKYAFDDKNRYWYYLRGFALAMQSGNTVYDQTNGLRAVSDQVFDVLFDNYRKRILVAARKQKFPCQYDKGSYSPLPVANAMNVNGNIIRLHQCVDQTILFATDTGAIYSISKQNVCKPELAEFNLTGSVSWFCNDPSGDVWIAYDGRGLRRYQWRNGSLILKEEINKTHGLTGDYVSSLCFDDLGNLWVSSSGSVTVLAKQDNDQYKVTTSFREFDLGIENPGSALLTKDVLGNIWLSTMQRLVCFYTKKILNYEVPPPAIQIEHIKLDLQQTDWSKYADSLYSVFQLPYNLKLPYNKNNIGIYFKGISLSDFEQIHYSYQLKGSSDDWSSPVSNDFISFVKLPPGKYFFQVKAKLINSDWSEPALFEFEIKMPFWETWWFRLFILALAAALIILLFRFRLQQVKTRTEVRHQLLELEMKALKAQMNPHFIYNALNSIQSLIANDRAKEAGRYISQFAKLLRQVLDQSENKLITLEKELQTTELYISLESLRLNFEPRYTLNLAGNIQPASEKIPPLILQPFVENALWHGLSGKQGDKKIIISISGSDQWLHCIIEDNGVGRKQATLSGAPSPSAYQSKGIGITRKRLIDYNDNTATDPVIFTDLADEAGLATGTKVILTIRRTN